MNLLLRKVVHSQAYDNYRVVFRHGDTDFEIGSIGIQHGAGAHTFWRWAIDSVIPARELQMGGTGAGREDCMKQFRAAWERVAADPASLAEFLAAKRRPLR